MGDNDLVRSEGGRQDLVPIRIPGTADVIWVPPQYADQSEALIRQNFVASTVDVDGRKHGTDDRVEAAQEMLVGNEHRNPVEVSLGDLGLGCTGDVWGDVQVIEPKIDEVRGYRGPALKNVGMIVNPETTGRDLKDWPACLGNNAAVLCDEQIPSVEEVFVDSIYYLGGTVIGELAFYAGPFH